MQVGVLKKNPQNPQNSQQLVLASASPRRFDLLGQIHIIPDQILPADSDETPHYHERPNDYALRMACEKALLVAKRLASGRASAFILAGDTVVAAGRRILPKAETEQQARESLSILSGRRHRVYGGIALCLPDGSLRQRLVTSHVRFRRLSALILITILIGAIGRARLAVMPFKGWRRGLFARLMAAIRILLVSAFMMSLRCLMRPAGVVQNDCPAKPRPLHDTARHA